MATKTATRTRKPMTDAEREARKAQRAARVAALESAKESFELDEDNARMMRAFESLTTHYSEGNALLILAQADLLGLRVRNLADVGGYGAFQERGRQVRKGQHQAIFIWARVERKTDETADDAKVIETTDAEGRKVRATYRPQGIFHVSQTDPK